MDPLDFKFVDNLRPPCSKCGRPLILTRIETEEPGFVLRTYYCATCEDTAAVAAVVLLSLDCATATAGSSLMYARAQAKLPKANIFDPPPQRAPAMTPDERLKPQNDLTAALRVIATR
jgi:hypothetical protein